MGKYKIEYSTTNDSNNIFLHMSLCTTQVLDLRQTEKLPRKSYNDGITKTTLIYVIVILTSTHILLHQIAQVKVMMHLICAKLQMMQALMQ